jgi:transposase
MNITMRQFNELFPTSEACLASIWNRSFEPKPCKQCGLYGEFHKLPERPAYQCACGNQIYPLAGSICHKSTTDLRTWFLAIFFMTNTRSGMSALQFQRISGVTYKTAWRIFKQVRSMMDAGGDLLNGVVEVDETYLQANPRKNTRLPRGKNYDRSEIVMGMAEKGGRVIARHIDNAGAKALTEQIEAHVKPGTPIQTDGWSPYRKLPNHGYPHAWVDHEAGKYVVNGIGTQQIENFWSNFKRGLYGVYRHCGRAYVQQYANEYAWRYSYRWTSEKDSPVSMFELLLRKIA